MIGERLLDLRKDADLTQEQLGTLLQINKHSISSYEREKSEPPDAIKIEIAKYFGVSIDYLLGLTDNPNPNNGEHNILRLPADFPLEARKSLEDYIDFLKCKYARGGKEDQK